MAIRSGCKIYNGLTDYCYRNVPFVYTKDRGDLLVVTNFNIVGRNRFKIVCAFCQKPSISDYPYLQMCTCEQYFRGSPQDRCCEECKDAY